MSSKHATDVPAFAYNRITKLRLILRGIREHTSSPGSEILVFSKNVDGLREVAPREAEDNARPERSRRIRKVTSNDDRVKCRGFQFPQSKSFASRGSLNRNSLRLKTQATTASLVSD